MFTGIVEAVGTVAGLERGGEGARLTVDAGPLAAEMRRGESLCVSGACLTVTEAAGSILRFDASRETLERTTLGSFRPGRRVNLERALRADGRLGGHFVLGHVDAVGTAVSLDRRPGASTLRVETDPDLLLFVTSKGSVAVDGVSLTVAEVSRKGFSIALIPETLASTTLGGLKPGDAVNVEVDYLAKIVLKRLGGGGRDGEPGKPVDWGTLEQAGFL
ncbi:MAG: riboflavin synthase [Planctomycetes bacterium]|nr:riboflavin synthase [Planctomycetota bacterium]